MRVAIVYDRVNKWGGAERVLLALQNIFTNAQLFTSVYSPDKAKWTKNIINITPSYINKIPYIRYKHEYLSTLMPMAFESHNFDDFDLVITVTSEFAKGINTGINTLHLCYCLTPTRYLWSHYDFYFANPLLKLISRPAVGYLRRWDRVAANRPDIMISVSREVKNRIKTYYNRDSRVIHPPLMLSPKSLNKPTKKYYLVVSRLVPYKRVDLIVQTFNQNALPLVIVGTGSEEVKLKRIAGANIKFVKNISDEKLSNYYSEAIALIHPQFEDFGLTVLEAISHGTPVIAYAKGGVLDMIEDGVNGILFGEQSLVGILTGLSRFHEKIFDDRMIRSSAKNFSYELFKQKILNSIQQ